MEPSLFRMDEITVTDDRLELLDWATGVTRDYVQSIAETNQGVSKEALKAAAAALTAIGPSSDADATAGEIQAVRRDLEAKTRHLRGASRNASASALGAIETCWKLCVASSVPSGAHAKSLAGDLAGRVGLPDAVVSLIGKGTSPAEATALVEAKNAPPA
jgi:hypothetical protein